MAKYVFLFSLVFFFSCDFIEDTLGLSTKLDAHSITSDSASFYVNATYVFKAGYDDPKKEDNIKITWDVSHGTFLGDVNTGDSIIWISPDTLATVKVEFKVKSDKGSSKTSRTIDISNRTATITALNPSKTAVVQGNQVTFSPEINDPDNETLTYTWSVPAGSYELTTNNGIIWTSPTEKGKHTISLTVTDKNGASDTESVEIVVYRIQGSILVVNSGDNNIKHFSEDGDFIKIFSGFTQPKKILIDQESLNFWVMDDSENKISILKLDGTEIGTNSDFSYLKDISFDPRSKGAWFITDTVAALVDHIGNFKKQILGFKQAQRIVVGNNNDLYVFDNGNDQPLLYVINTDIPTGGYYNVKTQSSNHSTIQVSDSFTEILYNPFSENIWLMEKQKNNVQRMKKDSTEVFPITYNFTSPKLMFQDSEKRITWISDANQLVVFDGVNGALIHTFENFEDIGGIGIITYTNTNEAWVADKLNHRILRIDVSGNTITTITGVNTPKSVAVYNGN